MRRLIFTASLDQKRSNAFNYKPVFCLLCTGFLALPASNAHAAQSWERSSDTDQEQPNQGSIGWEKPGNLKETVINGSPNEDLQNSLTSTETQWIDLSKKNDQKKPVGDDNEVHLIPTFGQTNAQKNDQEKSNYAIIDWEKTEALKKIAQERIAETPEKNLITQAKAAAKKSLNIPAKFQVLRITDREPLEDAIFFDHQDHGRFQSAFLVQLVPNLSTLNHSEGLRLANEPFKSSYVNPPYVPLEALENQNPDFLVKYLPIIIFQGYSAQGKQPHEELSACYPEGADLTVSFDKELFDAVRKMPIQQKTPAIDAELMQPSEKGLFPIFLGRLPKDFPEKGLQGKPVFWQENNHYGIQKNMSQDISVTDLPKEQRTIVQRFIQDFLTNFAKNAPETQIVHALDCSEEQKEARTKRILNFLKKLQETSV